MSKSRRKIGKIGIAESKNTEFYRIANQKDKGKGSTHLRYTEDRTR